jgi:pimeloyl-ACP methyl ester carboxylesterase
MRLQSGRSFFELFQLNDGSGPSLLLLHQLYGSSSDWNGIVDMWPGAVFGLDFSGHGRSEWLSGGAYYPELFVAQADAAAESIGPVAIAGTGLGAYVAVLLAGARCDSIAAALIAPGRGLAGGGALPRFDLTLAGLPALPKSDGGTDPAVAILERDVRPVDYVTAIARRARSLLFLENELEVPWWRAACELENAATVTDGFAGGLRRLAQIVGGGTRS